MRTTIWMFLMGWGCTSSDSPDKDKGTSSDTAASTTGMTSPSTVDWSTHPILTGDLKIVAHRGGSFEGPENTLDALRISSGSGAHMFEIDVWSTADDVLVLMHDDMVDRTTNGTGVVRNLTYSEISELDAGYMFTLDGGKTFPFRDQGVVVPTLAEVLAEFSDKLFSIEIKQQSPSIVDDVVALIDSFDMRDQVVIGAFEDEVLLEVREAAPDILTTFGVLEGMTLYFLPDFQEADYVPPTYYFAAPLEYEGLTLDMSKVEKCHRLGITLHVWTINEVEEMQTVIDWGVDGIITDLPSTLSGML
jgi:glycerophosphoryl diester phosphodiesterase